MTLSDLAKYSMTRSACGLFATAELLVLLCGSEAGLHNRRTKKRQLGPVLVALLGSVAVRAAWLR